MAHSGKPLTCKHEDLSSITQDLYLKIYKNNNEEGMLFYTCNPSTKEMETARSLGLVGISHSILFGEFKASKRVLVSKYKVDNI